MPQTALIIIGIVIVVVLLFRKPRERVVGICADALDRTVRKNENKEKALKFVEEKQTVGNEEIREHLGVSRRTVVRYMDMLEKEGKVEQVGKVGFNVFYKLK